MTILSYQPFDGTRFAGEIKATDAGIWAVRDVAVVPDEQFVAGDVRGFGRD